MDILALVLAKKMIEDLQLKTINGEEILGEGNIEIIGGGGGGDWDQNDPNAEGYIKNRTHYKAYEDVEVEKPLIITWDGNTDGKVQAISSESGQAAPIYKFSDEILTDEQFKQSICTAMGTAQPLIGMWEDGLANGYLICREDITAFSNPPFCVVREDNVELNGLVFPEKGIYSINNEGLYFSKIETTYRTTEKIEVVHHLDSQYIKDMYYDTSSIEEKVLVNNLTYDSYGAEDKPRCTFIPGQEYSVIWNGTRYDNLICVVDGGYNVIADGESVPFYIDDDGGNSLYVGSEFETLTIIAFEITGQIQHIDEKYIPGTIARITDIPEFPEQMQANWTQTNSSVADYIKNKPTLGSLAAKNKVSKTDLETDMQNTLDGAIQNIESGSGISTEKTEDTVTIALDNSTKNIIDNAVQTVATDVGLVAYKNNAEVQIGFDNNVVFLLNGGDATQECNPGLYDSEGELVADWTTLTETYNMQVEKAYSDLSAPVVGQPTYVIELISQEHPNEELCMILDKDVGAVGSCAFYKSDIHEIILPYNITNIGTGAFQNCSNLTSITIPDSVTRIGTRAFQKTGLTSINIPSSVTSLDSYTFSSCPNLEKITVDPNNTTYCGDGNCIINISNKQLITGCKNTVIPNDGSVTSIGGAAFLNCIGLSNINIPNSITSIGGSTFAGCTGLTSIEIPDSVTTIERQAFQDCINADTLILPNGLTHIEIATFSNCAKLNVIDIPAGVTNIGSSAFSDCSGLTSVTIPDSVTNIDSSAFSGCSSLLSLTIPDSVTNIGSSAFSGCSSLLSLTIPRGVTSIGAGMISGCTGLENITVDVNNTTYHSNGNCIIHTANKTLVIGYKNSIIPNDGSVTSIGSKAFSGCSNITHIEIPDNVTSINSSAFSGCTGLTSIEIPGSVTNIGSSLFSGCVNLENVTVDVNNTIYHSSGNCIIHTANKQLVTGCKNSVIPNDGSVVSIGSRAFSGDGLTNIIIPNSITSIESYAFSSCTDLTSIEISNSVTTIGSYAFYNCSNITHVEIPEGVTKISDSTFSYCTNLQEAIIPSSVTSIDNYAFDRCSNLTSITVLATTPPTIKIRTFDGCKALSEIKVPAESVDAYKAASYWSKYADNIVAITE